MNTTDLAKSTFGKNTQTAAKAKPRVTGARKVTDLKHGRNLLRPPDRLHLPEPDENKEPEKGFC